MANPLFNLFNNSGNNNMARLIQQFNQFRQTFQGDPRQQVQDLLNSGKMSQEQYNQLYSMAQTFQQFINR